MAEKPATFRANDFLIALLVLFFAAGTG